jgi:hypothetical protein
MLFFGYREEAMMYLVLFGPYFFCLIYKYAVLLKNICLGNNVYVFHCHETLSSPMKPSHISLH